MDEENKKEEKELEKSYSVLTASLESTESNGLGEEKDSVKAETETKVPEVESYEPVSNVNIVDQNDSAKFKPEMQKKKVADSPAKKRTKKAITIFCIVALIAFILVVTGIIIGATGYPKVVKWLSDHNFSVDEKETNTDISDENSEENSTNITIQSEESVVKKVVEKASESVVSIAVLQVALSDDGVTETSSNIGSGFVVDGNGLIITNWHVVLSDDVNYKVITSDEKEHDVVKVYRDSANDIALVQIKLEENEKLKPLKLGDSDNLARGQLVIAIGTPLGEYAGSVTTGVVSGLNRSIPDQNGRVFENVIQTDAALNMGNSGGPLLNSTSEVVGINFATTYADNISFALPINIVKRRLEEYRKYGKFIMPYLGVETEIISEFEARYIKNVKPGAFVVRVAPDSPAKLAGIENGDIITQVGGEKVENALFTMIQKYKVGDQVELIIWRQSDSGGEEKKIVVVLGEVEG